MKLSELNNKIQNISVIKNKEISGLKMATTPTEEGDNLSFINDLKYIDIINKDKTISSLITTEEIRKSGMISEDMGLIVAENPKKKFYEIHNYLATKEFYWSKHQNQLSESSIISKDAIIGEHSIKIGKNSVIEANAVIHPGVIIGDNVTIRSGCQIGGSGFQFLNIDSKVINVESAGRVIIEDSVEIQHNSCVDKGVFGGNTLIKKNVKIDNFVHIAHDDVIGERTFITAGVKLSGRVIIGTDCWLGVNATISNGIKIGNNSKVTLGSVVTRDVDENTTVTGNFAIEHSKFMAFLKKIR